MKRFASKSSAIAVLLIVFLAILISKTQIRVEISNIKTPETISQRPRVSVNVPILIYHYIREVDPRKDYLGADLSVPPENFEEQLAWLQKNNYTTITLDDIVSAWEKGSEMPEKPVILTFDDGYDDFFSVAYPLLQKYNAKATAYIITNFLDEPRYMTTSQLKELGTSPLLTIASHTERHPDLRILKISRLREELVESKKLLEDLNKKPIYHFAYPFGYYTSGIAKEVEKAGYKTAVITLSGTKHTPENRLMMKRVRIAGGLTIEKFAKLIKGVP